MTVPAPTRIAARWVLSLLVVASVMAGTGAGPVAADYMKVPEVKPLAS